MLEKMSDFFEARLDGYDEHMMTNIDSADQFYPFTAQQLPATKGCRILDLGCGTGLELQSYFPLNPSARVTGIDLSQGMLSALEEKFADRDICLICGSYFDVPFEADAFDAEEKKLMAQGVAAFGGIAPTYRIALLDKPTIVWDFHSLLIGLQMMFSFMMAEDKTPLRMCAHCDTIFVAKRSNQRFCCDACRRKGE